MSHEHLTDDLLAVAAAGLLDDAQKDSIHTHVRACAACEERLRDTMAHQARVLAQGVPARQSHGGFELPAGAQVRALRPQRSARRRVAAGLALAASVLLALFFLRPSADQPDSYWIPEGQGLTISRSAVTPPDELVRAIELYHQHDLDAAMELLEGVEVPQEYGDLRALYLASIYLNQEQAQRALDTLPDPIRLPSLRAGQVLWIRYLALDQTNQSEAAAALLRELAERRDAIGERAREHAGERTP